MVQLSVIYRIGLVLYNSRNTRPIFNSREEFEGYVGQLLRKNYNRIQNYRGYPRCNYMARISIV
jgi:hypothetical protein